MANPMPVDGCAPARKTASPDAMQRPCNNPYHLDMRDPRLEKLADVLVNYSVGVQPRQLVRVHGPPSAAPLIIELYRKVIAAGGHPVARTVPDELEEIFFKEASEEQITFLNPISLFEVERIDCSI